MIRAFFFLLLLVFVAFFIGVAMLILNAFYFISSPTGSKNFKRAIEKLRESIQKQNIQLIPHEEDTLPLLNAEPTLHQKPNFFRPIGTAVLATIYSEPYLAISYQKAGNNSIMLAKSGSNSEIVLRTNKGSTEIWLNEKALGVYKNGTLSSGGLRSSVLASVEGNSEDEWISIRLNDKKTAIANPKMLKSVNPRAITLFGELTEEEEYTLLALTLLLQTQPQLFNT